jgi:hypothetical protein
MVKYDPEFVAAKRKKAQSLPVATEEQPRDFQGQSWQDLMSQHALSTFSEDFWGMSTFQVQSCEVTSGGRTCQNVYPLAGFFPPQGTPSARFP